MSEIKINHSFLNNSLFNINEDNTVVLDKNQYQHYIEATKIAREKIISYHNHLLNSKDILNKNIETIKDNLNLVKKEYNNLSFIKKLSKDGKSWKELIKSETNELKEKTLSLDSLNKDIKKENLEYKSEMITVDKIDKFLNSIPTQLDHYNSLVINKNSKINELNDIKEIIELQKEEILKQKDPLKKTKEIKDLISFEKEFKSIKSNISLIDFDLKLLKTEAKNHLNQAKKSLKSVSSELYKKIKQENYLKSTLTRINENIIDNSINLFNNSISASLKLTIKSIDLINNGIIKVKDNLSKLHNKFTNQKPAQIINKKTKDELEI